ncbi:MAG: serine hydrolase [Candidatus Zixiibacteriota bacterium]|nr:MAG: serine hydrolase [candidate division Zixibacteria bacterium]
MRTVVSQICGILILMVLTTCVPDAPFKITGPSIPAQLDDGWDIATPEEVGISRQALDSVYAQFVAEDRFFNAKSLLVVKDGRLIFETYCRDLRDRDRYSNIQSVTKSVTSLVFGIVFSEQHVDSLNQTLYSIFPDKFPSDETRRSITIRHLFTMTSGLLFDNDVFSQEIYADQPDDPTRYILDKPMYAVPGEEFYYRDCDPHLLSYTIARLTGRSLEQWARERLFDPLGIESCYWDADHTGTTMGAHGLHLKPRDLAKIGQLALDHGRWDNQQIVDSAWVAESTRRQITTPYQTAPNTRDYGYYWWVLPQWEAFEAWGHGGNCILIVPDQQLVIVMTSMPHTDDDVVGTRPEQFHELVSPLVWSE